MAEDHEDFEREYEPLVERLRNLTWPEVDPHVRERCWRDFQRMMGESGLRPGASERQDPDEDFTDPES